MPKFSRNDYDPRESRANVDRDSRDDRQERRTHAGNSRPIPEDVAAAGDVTTGRIKNLNREKGFGFIRGDNGQEYFFHRSETRGEFDSLSERDPVQFQPMSSSKGPRAHAVVRIVETAGGLL